MTNIKFLKGYGISIRQNKNQIQLTNGSDPFTNKRETESYYENQIPYEKEFERVEDKQRIIDDFIHFIEPITT